MGNFELEGKKLKKTSKLFLGVTVASFLIAGVAYYNYKPNNTIVLQGEYAFDSTLDAKQVFVGKVVNKTETIKNDGGVYTLYSVEVEEPLKGDLTIGKVITVSQAIGYDNSEKATIKHHKNDDYLVAGNSYVLSTSNLGNKHIYQITTPYFGNIKIKNKGDVQRDEVALNEFKEALKKNSQN